MTRRATGRGPTSVEGRPVSSVAQAVEVNSSTNNSYASLPPTVGFLLGLHRLWHGS